MLFTPAPYCVAVNLLDKEMGPARGDLGTAKETGRSEARAAGSRLARMERSWGRRRAWVPGSGQGEVRGGARGPRQCESRRWGF